MLASRLDRHGPGARGRVFALVGVRQMSDSRSEPPRPRLGECGGSALPDAGSQLAISSRHAEGRWRRCESGFCQFCPTLRGSGLTTTRGKLAINAD